MYVLNWQTCCCGSIRNVLPKYLPAVPAYFKTFSLSWAMLLCQTTLCCSFRLPAWCIFHDNLWDEKKNLRVSSLTDPGGELPSNSSCTAASLPQTGREDKNHPVKHPGICESKFPNSTKLANKHYVFMPLILSFQEGDIRLLYRQSEDKRLVAESTLGKCLRKDVEGWFSDC